jgi:hypothetical protein
MHLGRRSGFSSYFKDIAVYKYSHPIRRQVSTIDFCVAMAAFDASLFVAAPFNASTYLAVIEVTEVTHVGFTEIASSSTVLPY